MRKKKLFFDIPFYMQYQYQYSIRYVPFKNNQMAGGIGKKHFNIRILWLIVTKM